MDDGVEMLAVMVEGILRRLRGILSAKSDGV